MTFDSLAEETFYYRNSHLLTRPTKTDFPVTFYDSEETPFTAKYDFLTNTGIYIEFKAHQLNNIATKRDSILALKAQEKYTNNSNRDYKQLKLGWNHSSEKHSIISSVYGSKYLLVFKDSTKISTQSKNKMTSLGINWIYECELEDTLAILSAN